MRRHTRTGSTTLDHQPLCAATQPESSEPEQHDRPEDQPPENARQFETVVLPEPDVDRRLHDRRERQRMCHVAQPVGKEGKRQHHSREEKRERERDHHHAANVDDPERSHVVEKAKAEAHDHRERDAQEKCRGVGGRGVVEPEDERADQEREKAAEDEVVGRAAEVEGEPVALRIEWPGEVGRDRAVPDPERELVPAEHVDGHDQRLREPDVGHRVARVVATDGDAVVVDGEQDVGLDEAEDGVREHPGGRRPGVGGIAAPAPLRNLPVEPHRATLGSVPVSSPATPDRNLALELVRVTEAAAMGAGRWIGRGDKIAADQAAGDGMRAMLDTVVMRGVVVIGEGEKDEAPMLYNGEPVGMGADGPEVDVAVDPLEGTRLTALGQPNAIAVIAAADRGSMFFPGAAVYMEKIAAGADAIGAIDINASPTENVNAVAKAKGRRATDIRVVVLERDRHEQLIGELRQAGARVTLIRDGDVAPAIAAARPETGVDLLYGVGGTPEGVISAAALKCVGGGIQGKLWPRNDEERAALIEQGYDLDRVLTTDDLVTSDNVFVAATGVTTGALLRGIRYVTDGAITDSIVMRSRSGTVRRIEARHQLSKLTHFTGREY